jgi:hypothetical protein
MQACVDLSGVRVPAAECVMYTSYTAPRTGCDDTTWIWSVHKVGFECRPVPALRRPLFSNVNFTTYTSSSPWHLQAGPH